MSRSHVELGPIEAPFWGGPILPHFFCLFRDCAWAGLAYRKCIQKIKSFYNAFSVHSIHTETVSGLEIGLGLEVVPCPKARSGSPSQLVVAPGPAARADRQSKEDTSSEEDYPRYVSMKPRPPSKADGPFGVLRLVLAGWQADRGGFWLFNRGGLAVGRGLIVALHCR